MHEVLTFFLNCMAIAVAVVFTIVALTLIFGHLMPWIFNENDESHVDKITQKRLDTLKSLTGPMVVHLNNGTRFDAQKVIDIQSGMHDGHDDFVMFVNASGKKKYARFCTIRLVEEQHEKLKNN
jgi:hypothetical protein